LNVLTKDLFGKLFADKGYISQKFFEVLFNAGVYLVTEIKAKNLSDRFGKVLQLRQSITINRQDKSTSLSTQMDSLIPASKISNLTQGVFVGAVSDNFEERIEQKIFHAEIVVDNTKVAAETKAYKIIPEIASFVDSDPTNEKIH
jgi:hypothetical protein